MFGCSISTPRGVYSISTPGGEIRLNILYLSQYCGTKKHERMENVLNLWGAGVSEIMNKSPVPSMSISELTHQNTGCPEDRRNSNP